MACEHCRRLQVHCGKEIFFQTGSSLSMRDRCAFCRNDHCSVSSDGEVRRQRDTGSWASHDCAKVGPRTAESSDVDFLLFRTAVQGDDGNLIRTGASSESKNFGITCLE